MHQQGAGAIQIHHRAFLQQSAATGGSEIVTEHEVTVTMHEVELAAVVTEAAEGADGFLIEGGVIVVADPGFEQVAQYVQRICLARVSFEQLAQGFQMFRSGRV